MLPVMGQDNTNTRISINIFGVVNPHKHTSVVVQVKWNLRHHLTIHVPCLHPFLYENDGDSSAKATKIAANIYFQFQCP